MLRKRASCFALMWCGYPCFVSLSHEAMGHSAVYDCKISWSYSCVERRRLLAEVGHPEPEKNSVGIFSSPEPKAYG